MLAVLSLFLIYLHVNAVGISKSGKSGSSSSALQGSSHTYHIYIESTDAFQVAYHATFPVFLERSIGNHLNRPGMRLRSIRNMKFKNPAIMGNTVQFEVDGDGTGAKCMDGTSMRELYTARKAFLLEQSWIYGPLRLPLIADSLALHKSEYTVYPDEMQQDINNVNIRKLTTRTIFNLFERARTDLLGGPAALADLLKSDFKVYVVRITNYELISDIMLSKTEKNASTFSLEVWSQIALVGKSMVDFYQQVVLVQEGKDDLEHRVLAAATITCCSIDAMSGNPAPLPGTWALAT